MQAKRGISEAESHTGLPLSVLLAAGAFCLGLALIFTWSTTFSQFAFYDDQGFMMVSVKGFIEGHRLYDEVFTWYGPCYYFYEAFLHWALRIPLNHNLTGLLCVLHWTGASAVLAWAGMRLTCSWLIGLLVFLEGVVHLRGMAGEPGHPQELVALLLATAILAVAKEGSGSRKFALLGVVCGALAFTKINVGAWFALAVILSMLTHTCGRLRSVSVWGAIVAAGGIPMLLMREHLSDSWVFQYCWLASIATLMAGAVGFGFSQPSINAGDGWRLGWGFAGITVAFILGLLLAGSSLPAIAESLLIGPSKLAVALTFGFEKEGSLWSASAAFIAAGAVLVFRRQLVKAALPLGVVKVIYGLLGLWILVADRKAQLAYLSPWLWLALIPCGSGSPERPRETFGRTLLCLAAAWETLQAYPAAGTQASLATFLSVLVYAVCFNDGLAEVWTEVVAPSRHFHWSRGKSILVRAACLLLMIELFAFKWATPIRGWRAYATTPAMRLPGADWFHVPEYQTAIYRELTDYLARECDTFFTKPGLNSLYFWTGQQPPTYLNVAEMMLLNSEQQTRVVAALRRTGRLLIVLNQQSVPFQMNADAFENGPLTSFIRRECLEVRRVGSFEIVRPKIGDQEAPLAEW